jgi:hypothetical protein
MAAITVATNAIRGVFMVPALLLRP